MGADPRLVRLLGAPELDWLLQRARRRMERGEPLTGTVTLTVASPAQRDTAARLLGRRPTPGAALTLRWEAVDAVLRRSGAHPDGLASAVVALTGPVRSRAAEAAARDQAWHDAFAPLDHLVETRPELAGWVTTIRATGLVRRLAATPEAATPLLAKLTAVLAELPTDGEPIGQFAERMLGSAHTLDDDRPLATLAFGAAKILRNASDGSGASWRRQVWAGVGLIRDDLSSTVLTLGLPGDRATATGRALAALRAVGEPTVLTLRQLVRKPPGFAVAGATVSICENPIVVGAAADRLGQVAEPLVCVSGQPCAAAMHLLRMLAAGGARLRYHGDFDWGGLRIGNWLFDRLPLLDLDGLDRTETAELVRLCLGASELPDGLVDAVATACEGVPLFIERFLHDVREQRHLIVDGHRWWFALPVGWVPVSFARGVAHRLDAVPAGSRDLLRVAALLGRTVDATRLARASGTDLATARAALDAGSRSQLGVDVSTGWRFRHALTRDAVLAATPHEHRRRLAGGMLEHLAGSAEHAEQADRDEAQLAVLATVAEAAGQPARAARILLRAATRAVQRGVLVGAVEELKRAVTLSRGQVDLGLEAREALVRARALGGEVDSALAEGAELIADLTAWGAPAARLVGVRLSLARAAAVDGRFADAAALLAQVDNDADPAIAPAAQALTALVALSAGRFDEAAGAATSAVELGESMGDNRSVCEAQLVLGRLARRADLNAAERWFRSAALRAESAGLARWLADALHELATVAQLRTCDVDGLYRARDAAVAAGAAGLQSGIEFHLAALHGVRFEPDLALAIARGCLVSWRRLGAPYQQAMSWILIGQAHAAAGRRQQAEAAAREAEATAPGHPEVVGMAWGTCRGLAALLDEDRPAAIAAYRRSVALLRQLPEITPLPPWYLWPLLAALDGQGAPALAETNVPSLQVARGPHALWHLAAAVTVGRARDRSGAEASATEALTILDPLEHFAGYRHLALRLAAESAIADGWGDPVSWLTTAETWFTAHGLDATARGCRAQLTRAGVPRRGRSRSATGVPADLAAVGVTARELDVMRLVAAGLSNREIAERLYVGVRTVKTHVEHLLAKTGTPNPTTLAALLPDQPDR